MATEIKLPQLGENLPGGDVLDVKVAPGDDISPGQTLLEVEADRAAVHSADESIKAENAAVERAKVQEITPHDLRHTCASLAVSSGANVLAVSRMLGHKDPSVTLRIYADLFDSDLDAVAVNLDAKIADSVQTVSKAPADRRRSRRRGAI